MSTDRYTSPLSERYASKEMQYLFSPDNKFRTWRRLWVALARAEMKQGLTNITPEMVAELEAHVDDINYEVAIEREKLVRHDVMSHVYAYGQQCRSCQKHTICRIFLFFHILFAAFFPRLSLFLFSQDCQRKFRQTHHTPPSGGLCDEAVEPFQT